MFAEAMQKFAMYMVSESEDLVDECLAYVHMMDPSWLTSYIGSLPSAVNARGTNEEPVDLNDSEEDEEELGETPRKENVPASSVGAGQKNVQNNKNAAAPSDNDKHEDVANERLSADEAGAAGGLQLRASAAEPAAEGAEEHAVIVNDSSDYDSLEDYCGVEI